MLNQTRGRIAEIGLTRQEGNLSLVPTWPYRGYGMAEYWYRANEESEEFKEQVGPREMGFHTLHRTEPRRRWQWFTEIGLRPRG